MYCIKQANCIYTNYTSINPIHCFHNQDCLILAWLGKRNLHSCTHAFNITLKVLSSLGYAHYKCFLLSFYNALHFLENNFTDPSEGNISFDAAKNCLFTKCMVS